jgi:hypothetical protein
MLTKQPKSSFLDRNIDILTVQAIKTGLESMAVTSVRAFDIIKNAVAASRRGWAALDPKGPYKICQVRESGIERYKGGCTYVKSACRTPIKTKDISFICSVPPSISIVSISFFLIPPLQCLLNRIRKRGHGPRPSQSLLSCWPSCPQSSTTWTPI